MRGFLGLLLVLLVSGSLCYGNAKTVEVVGFGECADCKENNFKTSQALSGLKVTIDCKLGNGHFQKKGEGKLSEDGYFKVSLPEKIIKDGKLAEECYVQLHNAANAPCAFHDGLEASKVTFVSKSNEKHTFGTTGKLKFSSAICTSASFLPPMPTPPFPKVHPWLKKFGHIIPKYPLPPKIPFKKPFGHYPLPSIPIKKPCPPPVVVVKPEPKPEPKPKPKEKPQPKPEPKPMPQPKPCPPVGNPEPKPEPNPQPKPEPKPTVPIYKPHPKIIPTVPIYKPHPKILPPPIPIYKPHPKILPPPIPIYKPIPKTLPSFPPIYKKPCPPFPLPKLPPLPSIHKKFFHDPLFPVPPHP